MIGHEDQCGYCSPYYSWKYVSTEHYSGYPQTTTTPSQVGLCHRANMDSSGKYCRVRTHGGKMFV